MVFSTRHSVLSTQYSVQSTQYSVLVTQFKVLSTCYSVQSTWYSVLSTCYSVQSTQYSVLCIQFKVLSTQNSVQITQYSVSYCTWCLAGMFNPHGNLPFSHSEGFYQFSFSQLNICFILVIKFYPPWEFTIQSQWRFYFGCKTPKLFFSSSQYLTKLWRSSVNKIAYSAKDPHAAPLHGVFCT